VPLGAEDLARCEPVYEEVPGRSDSTVGISSRSELPANALAYLARIEDECGVRVDMISTGPDREETIVLRHPFA
jgi:adenylosuccinate synthase